MNWSELPLHPTSRTLRQFAGLWLVVCSAFATWESLIRQRQTAAVALAALGLTIGLLGLWRPHLVRPLYVGGVVAGFPLGWLLSRFSLALVFYLVVTPLGVGSRWAGRDRLSLRRKSNEQANWIPLSQTHDVRRYFRQY
ncbi:MAG TPA: hypothetical protein VHC19_22985 [Pirellulales bacterium]|jgi:hypothetical protein|nr:hypothetical protein [Pirellulales bacterium]